MVGKAERQILDMVEQGQLSAEEGLRLINAMGGKTESGPDPDLIDEEVRASTNITFGDAEESVQPHIPEEEKQRMNRLKRWWVLPFGIGLLITTLGAILMYMGSTQSGFGFGFWLAWLPFLLGIFIVAVSFQTKRSVWLHVRVKQEPGETPQRISISLPMPIALTRWFFSAFGDHIPGLRDQPLGNIPEILTNLSSEEPFYVHVNEEAGEEVEIFIG
jgi:hypothetical protein